MANSTGVTNGDSCTAGQRSVHDGRELHDRAEGGLDQSCGDESDERVDALLDGDVQSRR
jgi:hypothetical protein